MKGKPNLALMVLSDLKKKHASGGEPTDDGGSDDGGSDEDGDDLEAMAQKCVDAKDGGEFLAAIRPLCKALYRE